MEVKLRQTSIEAVGNVPWGTHFCQFYQTKEDLIDILTPYFKAGLENNEFCMWITAEPLNAAEAHKALQKKVRNLDDYMKKGQIEILDYNQWYTKSENIEHGAITQDFINKERYALKKGFDGIRITGNSFLLERKELEKSSSYEEHANILIANYRMLALCSYSLDNCNPSEIIDVVNNHEFTLIKQEGKWKTIRSSERKKADEELKLHEIRLQALLDLNKMTEASEQKILDFVREEVIKVTQSQFAFLGFMNDDESVMTMDNWSKETMAKCAVVDKSMDFIVAEAGLWGEPVRQRRPVVVNDYNAPHPVKKGFPQGHVPIEKFLGIPVFDGEHIVAVAGVANKVNDYDESDIRAIESMMNDTWKLLRQKQNEKEIQNLAKFPSEDKNPVLRFSSDGTIIYANKASSIVLETWGCNIGERIPQPCSERITKAFELGDYEFEFSCDNGRVFSVTLAPV
ncbi:MAG: MEDS domain-containing protein, partial [Planctomycetota bacterium]